MTLSAIPPHSQPVEGLLKQRSPVTMQAVSRTGILNLTLSLILQTQLFVVGTPARSPQQPLPLDPLSHAEEESAAQIANAEPRVKSELGTGRHRLIQVELLAPKPDALQHPQTFTAGRYAAVLFYRYDTDRGIHVTVNLNQGSVVAVTRLSSLAIPLAREEVKEAFALALGSRELRAVLGPQAVQFAVANGSAAQSPENRVDGLRVIAPLAADPCHRHRCVELHFRTREGYLPSTSVTVDLSAQRIKVHQRKR